MLDTTRRLTRVLGRFEKEATRTIDEEFATKILSVLRSRVEIREVERIRTRGLMLEEKTGATI